MLSIKDIVKVNLSSLELELAFIMARQAEIGGASHIREANDRICNLSVDQFIGVGLGELAGNKHFFSINDYFNSRAEKNKNPYVGDNGCDTLGYKINYKTSKLKQGLDPMRYNLVVRPAERHSGFVYVQILVDAKGKQTPQELVFGETTPDVYLMGWVYDHELDGRQVNYGIFGPRNGKPGAFVIPVTELHPVSQLVGNVPMLCES
jgi:hypothetical protein